jgi:hypothetical protein
MPDHGARKRPAHVGPSQFQPQGVRTSVLRRQNISEEAERFLIVCEGEKTEPGYFEGFRVPGKILKIMGTGYNTLTLVSEAIRLKNESRSAYDQVWCVFDRDSFPSDDFDGAISKAKAAGFQVAYTNEAFELWYLLHFEDHRSALGRRQYSQKLSECLGHKYEKNSTSMYNELQSKQGEAIRRAERLMAEYDEDHNPHQNNPSTTVHLLVKALRANATPRPNVP